ncbi:MAG: PAS domain S-box protein [Bacteroidetes bacterium]|nr:MAG: PAS domain S-box protein [Bacteroidota bacterium]
MEHDLRKEAESLLESKFNEEQLKNKTTQELIHELKVHQIELELQNEELQKSQQELVASQQKYFELFDLAPVAYLMVDDQTRIQDLNLTAAHFLGEERLKLKNRRFDSFILPDHQDDFYLFFTNLSKETDESTLESSIQIQGKLHYIRIACNISKPSSVQNQSLIRLTLIDITAEKLAVKELEHVKERLELSLLGGNVAWWVWDYPSQTVYFDKRKAEMLGYEDGRMTQNVYEITSMIHPDDYATTMQHMRDHLEGRKPRYSLEYRLKTKQGQYKWFYDQGSVTQWSADGQPLKLAGVVIDITERKLAEIQHLESEKRFRQFATLLPQVICELDGDFNILYVNDYGRTLFGLKKNQGNNLFDFLDDHNKTIITKTLAKRMTDPDKKDPGMQIKFKDTEGNEVHLFTYANFETENGKLHTIRAIGIDLSERMKMEDRLNALNDELNAQKLQLESFNRELEEKVTGEVEKNRVKDHLMSLQARQAAMGEMVGHIAHQWKQPLNTLNLIILDLQDVFRYDELTEDYMDKSVASAKKVIQHMTQTIDDFRNFFKPLKSMTPFEVKKQVETALSFIRATVEIAGIRLENKIDEGICVKGFPNEFSQVVINIVNNGREAIMESNPSDPFIAITSEIHQNNIHLFFTNNGGEIPETILDKIFEPYFSTREKTQGTGIGLYLARTIITQNMKGALKVKNIHQGVRFEIVLPLEN